MFGHVHRAMCGGGCQFEVLEEYACACYVPAYKIDEADIAGVGAGGALEAHRRASEGACNFDRGEVPGPSLTEGGPSCASKGPQNATRSAGY